MKIVVFADVHYFGGDIEKAKFNKEKKLVKYAVPLMERLVDTVNSDNIDACVNLGDLIQDVQDKQRDIECLKLMFEKIDRMNCPCYSVFGNHDLKAMDSIAEFEEAMGCKTTFSLDSGGYHLVFLTTELRPELGLARGGCYKAQYLSAETLEWLKADLERNNLPCVIFTHYAIAEDESIQDECMFMKNRADVKKIINNDKNILAVFSGHLHITKELEENGLKYYLLGSMTACGETPGVPTGVYFELDLCDNKLTVTEKHIEL